MTDLMTALAEAKRSIDFPRHAALHATSEAEITRLRAENARLREAVKRAAAQFSYYAELHALKPDPVKAASNQKWADEMVAALKEGGGE